MSYDYPNINEGTGRMLTIANLIGHMVEDIFGFCMSMVNGYFIMLLMLSIGIILALYFRFFRDYIGESFK